MADTLTTQSSTLATIPASSVIATDDAGASGHVQLVKLALSADGSATPITADANGMEVQGAGTAGTATGGVVTVQGVASMTPVQIGDNSSSLTVDNGGTFVVQENGSALTALQLIDDPVKVLGTDTYTEATSKGSVVAAVRRDADTTLVDTTNEFGPLQMDANGRLKVEAFSGETLPVSLTSTTVTGTVAVTQSGTWDEIGINDSGNSITVDAPVGTPAFVRLSDGSSAITTLAVSLASVPSHAVTNAGTFATQVDGAALTALQLIDDSIKVDDAAFTPATSSVTMAGFEADETATDSVDEGDAGAARMTLDRKQIVNPQPHTAGGLSIFRSLDLDETEEDVKTSAGQVYGMWVTNTATSTRFVKFYNLTAANTTVGSSTPVITIGIPGNSSDDIAGLFSSAMGIAFDTAICAAATTGAADNDSGAPGTGDVILNVFYK